MELIGKQLVDLANKSPLVRDYLSIPKGWKDIVKITNNSVHRLVGFTKDGNPIINANFIGSRKYKGKLTTNQMIRLVESGAFRHLGKRFGMEDYYDAVYTYAPRIGKVKDYAKLAFDTTGDLKPETGAGGANVTSDGYVRMFSSDATWATIRDGAGTNVGDIGITGEAWAINSGTTTDRFNKMTRSIFTFDTSAMGAGATTDSGYFKLYGASKTDGLSATPTLNIYSAAPNDNADLVAGDFDSLGTTAYCDTAITYAGFDTAGYNQFNLNSSGKSGVVPSGITQIGTRNPEYDVADSAPTWSSSADTEIHGTYADNGSLEPILNVTYSLPSTGNRPQKVYYYF